MFKNWPLLFIIIPVIEIYLLITVGTYIGALWTVLLVITTAVIGINLLRYQGFATLARAQKNMAQGIMPATEMIEGLCLAVGGALLITPGFLTDAIGFICLIPLSRRALIRYIMTKVSMQVSGIHTEQQFSKTQEDKDAVSSGRTFEGEYTRKED